jgi:hypothetical protein
MEPHSSSLQKIQDVTSQSPYKRDTFLWKVLITNTIRSRNLQKNHIIRCTITFALQTKKKYFFKKFNK